MKNKVKVKVLKKICSYKDIVEDFEEYMNDVSVMNELRDMPVKQAISVIREVWEECKSTN